jgi:hypothetical protein
VAIVVVILLNAAFMNLVSISLLWTLSGEGVMRAAPPLVMVFSGMLIPLAFFPDRLQPLLRGVHRLGPTTVRITDPFGFPLRLRTSTKLGFKNAKWITAIEVTNTFPSTYWSAQGFNWFSGI